MGSEITKTLRAAEIAGQFSAMGKGLDNISWLVQTIFVWTGTVTFVSTLCRLRLGEVLFALKIGIEKQSARMPHHQAASANSPTNWQLAAVRSFLPRAVEG
jgi:hypothetical protein